MHTFRKELCPVCGGKIKGDRKLPYCSMICEKSITGYTLDYITKLDREALKLGIDATTAWRPQPLEPTVSVTTGYPTLVINDIHTPIHDPVWTEQALVAAHKFECRTLIIGGDLIDANTISKYVGAEYRRRADLEGDLAAAEGLIKIFDGMFDKIYYTLGNHSQRLIMKMGGEVTLQRLLKMVYTSEKFKATERHYLILNGNTRILHPRSYSRIRGKLTADYAQRYQCHLITGHHHHSASTLSADAKWQVVENGCLAQINEFSYAEYAMMGMPEMCNGFAIALPESEKNRILAFNKFSSWKHFGLPELGK